jgi:hypothetical protein
LMKTDTALAAEGRFLSQPALSRSLFSPAAKN